MSNEAKANATVCTNCEHHRTTGGDEWHQHLCYAPAVLRITFDYVRGKTVTERPVCRDINTDGKCPHYLRLPDHLYRIPWVARFAKKWHEALQGSGGSSDGADH